MKKILIMVIVVVALQLGIVSIASASGGSYHKVRYGETLYSIGRYYRTTAYKIAEVNGLYDPDHIYAGQVLYIPTDGYGKDNDRGHKGYDDNSYHKVRYGETLYSIGRYYKVNPDYIAEANNLYNPNYIYAGQKLYIPSGKGYGYGKDDYSRDKQGYGYDNSDYGRGKDDYSRDKQGYGYDNSDYGRGKYDRNKGDSDSNYGYDQTGYYYNRGGKQYSYTCGHFYKCW